MTFHKILITTILFLCSSAITAYCQNPSPEFNKLKTVINPDLHKHNFSFKGLNNEAEFVFTGLFVFYKTFISSQDGGSCTFTPSCSEYALQSIKKKGIFVGLLNSFDRLIRCNGLSPENYKYDKERHLLIDPVE